MRPGCEGYYCLISTNVTADNNVFGVVDLNEIGPSFTLLGNVNSKVGSIQAANNRTFSVKEDLASEGHIQLIDEGKISQRNDSSFDCGLGVHCCIVLQSYIAQNAKVLVVLLMCFKNKVLVYDVRSIFSHVSLNLLMHNIFTWNHNNIP